MRSIRTTVANATGIGLTAASSTCLLLQAIGMLQLNFNAWLFAGTGVGGLALIVLSAAWAHTDEEIARSMLSEKERRTAQIIGDANKQMFVLNHGIMVLMDRAGLSSFTFGTEDFIKIAGRGAPMLFETPWDDTYTVVSRRAEHPRKPLQPPKDVVESS